MRLIDKIALNRLIQTIADFILKIIELCQPKKNVNIDVKPDEHKPDRKPILPWRRKKNEDSK